MNILITGGTGFIGYHLIKRLSRKYHTITCVIRRSSKTNKLREFPVDFIFYNDVKNGRFDFAQFDVVYHLASIRHKWGTSWEEYRKTGQEFTKYLLESSVGKVDHFIFCSSVAVYGFPKKLPISESTPKNPSSLYGKMKLECENIIHAFCERYMLPQFTIIQPSIVYGENDPTGMMTRLVKMIYDGSYHTVGNGKNHMQFIYIEDLIDLFEKVGTQLPPTNTCFISSYKEQISVNDLVALIRQKLNKTATVELRIPRWIARIGAGLLDFSYKAGLKLTGPEPLIAKEKIETMTKNVTYDIAKAEHLLDFKPIFSYKAGIDRLISYLIKEYRWKE